MDMKEKHGIKDKMNRIDYRMEDRPSYLNENSRNNISTEKIVGNIIEHCIYRYICTRNCKKHRTCSMDSNRRNSSATWNNATLGYNKI